MADRVDVDDQGMSAQEDQGNGRRDLASAELELEETKAAMVSSSYAVDPDERARLSEVLTRHITRIEQIVAELREEEPTGTRCVLCGFPARNGFCRAHSDLAEPEPAAEMAS